MLFIRPNRFLAIASPPPGWRGCYKKIADFHICIASSARPL